MPEESVASPGAGVMCICELPDVGTGQSDPLGDQQVLLPPELPL